MIARMGQGDWTTWTVRARNLPEHSGNPVHTDVGARTAGYPRALVAGVTTYAYLVHPVLVTWGLDWLARGGAEVRFRSPVFDGEELQCVPTVGVDDAVRVDVGSTGAEPLVRATLDVHASAPEWATGRSGESLEPDWVMLSDEYGSGYAERAGDPLDLCARSGLVHPAVWPALANRIVHRQVAHGPWVHVASRIVHHRAVAEGSVAELVGTVVQRTQRRSGQWATIDVVVFVDEVPAVTIEHEAIVELA